MKLPRKSRGELSATITQTLLLITACTALFGLTAFGAHPNWWDTSTAVDPTRTRDDHAVVIQGQLKQFTLKAVKELNNYLPGGAGSQLNDMVTGWKSDYTSNGYNAGNIKPSDYAAVNVGQLKYIGNKVWDRLVAGGYVTSKPAWMAVNAEMDNHLANIGQLKTMFDFDLSILPSSPDAPVITSPSAVAIAVGTAFTYTITATHEPTAFSATGLPPGLSLSGAIISGTPTETGIFFVMLSATNSHGTGQGAVAISVLDGQSTPVINSPLTESATSGSGFAYRITAIHNPTSFSATNLPAGLEIDSITGIISGTTSSTGTYSVGLSASNTAGTGSATLTLTIQSSASLTSACVITSASAANATVGQSFSYTITANNSSGDLTADGLPAWLTINTSTGLISGTPTIAGTFQFPIYASNSNSSDSKILTLHVTNNTPTITSSYSISGMVGVSVEYVITANNAPTHFSTSSLPAGFSLNASTGKIAGMPGSAGTYTITVSAQGPDNTAAHDLAITITPRCPLIYGSLSRTIAVGEHLSYRIIADPNPDSYGATDLPQGLTLNPLTGYISGTVSFPGTYSIPITASDSNGDGTATFVLTVKSLGPQVPVFMLPPIIYAKTGTSFSYMLPVGNDPTTFTVGSGELPGGLSFTDGTIAGTPTATGVSLLNLTATNAIGTSGAQVLLVVEASTPTVSVSGQSFQSGIYPYTGYATTSATIAFTPSGPSPLENQTYSGINAGGYDNTSTVYQRALVGFDLSFLPADVLVSNATLSLIAGSASTGDLGLYRADTHFYPDNACWTVNSGRFLESVTHDPVLLGTCSEPITSSTWSSDNLTAYVALGISQRVPLELMLVDSYFETHVTPGTAESYNFHDERDSDVANRPSLTLDFTTASPPVIFPNQVIYALLSGDNALPLGCLANGATFSLDAYESGAPLDNYIPVGMNMNSSTGVISGTPTTAGSYTFLVHASNDNGICTMPVTVLVTSVPAISVTPGSTTTYSWGTMSWGGGHSPITLTMWPGSSVSYALQVSGFPTSWWANGYYSQGLTFDPTTGTISGVPTTDAGGGGVNITATNPLGPKPISVEYKLFPMISGSTEFNTNAKVPFTANLYYPTTTEILPTGMDTSAEPPPPWLSVGLTGTDWTKHVVLSGTPPATGDYEFKLKLNPSVSDEPWTTITLHVTPVLSLQVAADSINAYVGRSLSYDIPTSWNPAPSKDTVLPVNVTWSLDSSSAALTSGLSLDSASGIVSGTPVTAGTTTVILKATYPGGSTTKRVAISVTDGPAITSVKTVFAPINVPFVYHLIASDFAVATDGTPGLPSSLHYAAITGLPSQGYITGTPGVLDLGTHTVTLSASDSSGRMTTADLHLSFTAITSPLTASGSVGQSFTYPITTSVSPDGYNAQGLPPGLGLASNVISGTPTAAGVWTTNLTTTYNELTVTAPLVVTITAASSDLVSSLQERVSPTSTYSAPSVMIKNGSQKSTVFNTDTVLKVGKESSTAISRAVMSFNLSSIPANATITSVKLVMNASSASSAGSPLRVEVHRALAALDPTVANWTNNNSYNSTSLASLQFDPATSGPATFYGTTDFTAQVQQAYQGGLSLDLMLLAPAAELASTTDYVGFLTRNADPTQNPKLIVTYTLGAPTSPPEITSADIVNGVAGETLTYNITASNHPSSYNATGLPGGLGVNTTTGVISNTTSTSVGSTNAVVTASNSLGTGSKVVTFNIDSVDPVTALEITGGNNQIGTAGSTLPLALKVHATTVTGSPHTLVTFSALPGRGHLARNSTGLSAGASRVTVPTNDLGDATAYFQLPSSFGKFTVTASVRGVTPVTFIENAGPTLLPDHTTDSGPGSAFPILSVIGGQSQSGPSGTALPRPYVIQALDRLGNPMSISLTATMVKGGGTVSTSISGTYSTPLSFTTGSDGLASVYMKPGTENQGFNVFRCQGNPVSGQTPKVYLSGKATSTVPGTPAPGGTMGTVQTDNDPPPPVHDSGGSSVGLFLDLRTSNPKKVFIPGYVGPNPLDYIESSSTKDLSSPLLTWNSVPGALYRLERSQNGDDDWISLLNSNLTSYQDSGLRSCTRYQYRLSAIVADEVVAVAYIGYGVPIVMAMIECDSSGNQTGNIRFDGEWGNEPFVAFSYFKFAFYPNSNGLPIRWRVGAVTETWQTPHAGEMQHTSPDSSEIMVANAPGVWDSDDYHGNAIGLFDYRDPCDALGTCEIGSSGKSFRVNVTEGNNAIITWAWSIGFNVYEITEAGARVPVFGPINVSYTAPLPNDEYNEDINERIYEVVPNEMAGNGSSIHFTTEFGDDAGRATDHFGFVYTTDDQSSTVISTDESAGPKYRKIALNGFPMPDEKPQATEETDQEKEQSYVDSLTLGLRHSTTDAYLPVSGSDFAIQARRDFRSEAWSDAGGLRPHEKITQPFGPCWSSSLCSTIQFNKSTDPDNTLPITAMVIDESGGVHTFFMYHDPVTGKPGFFPMPSARNEQQSPNLETLTIDDSGTIQRYIFKRKYGTTLTFELTSLSQSLSESRLDGSDYLSIYTYAHLTSAVDRVGNVLVYSYTTPDDLIPYLISCPSQPQVKLSIEQGVVSGTSTPSQSRITAIWDANGNKTTYHYKAYADGTYPSGSRKAYCLDYVTAPDGAVTTYDYQYDLEPDLTPPSPGQATSSFGHLDLASIKDPNNHKYQFSYADSSNNPVFDHSKLSTKNDTKYPQCGLPRILTKITLPDGTFSTFSNNNTPIWIIAGDPPTLGGHRTNTIVDANNATHIYRFSDAAVFALPKLGGYWAGSGGTNVICFKTTDIDYGNPTGSHYVGTEEFKFDPNAGMALSQITDLSKNVTKFAHEEAWNSGAAFTAYTQVIANPAALQLNGFYNDPTKQTDALNHSKIFTYDTDSRIMTSVQTARPTLNNPSYYTKTTYELDSLKRRTKESVTDSTGAVVQVTNWTYSRDYPGFIASKTVQSGLNGDGSLPPLATQYVPDQNGRVLNEIVDPNNLHLVTSYTYDKNGNKLSVTNPRGYTTWFSYDLRNRLTTVTYADGAQKQLCYDARGNKIAEYDENGNGTLLEYDELNRLIGQARDMDADGAIGERSVDLVTSFTYNGVNSKTSTTDPRNHQTVMEYDDLQRVTKLTDPLLNYTKFEYGTNSGGNAFDSSSFKPTRITDPRNFVTDVTYDALYHPKIKQVTFDSALPPSVISTVYDPVGNLLQSVDAATNPNTTRIEYDALNRPTLTTFADGSTTQVTYSSTGLKWKIEDQNNNVTETTYDGAARPITVTQPQVDDGTGTQVHPITRKYYDPAGNVLSTTNPRGQVWDNVYDPRNRLLQAMSPAVMNADSGVYERPTVITEYDPVGNVLFKTDARLNTTSMIYDVANRATDVYSPTTLQGTPHVHTDYDAAGNATDVYVDISVTGGTVHRQHTHNVYDELNRLHTTTDGANITVTTEYDAAGNKHTVADGKVVSGDLHQTTTFEYDGLNRNTYVTDATGRSTRFRYDGQNKVQRTDPNGQTTVYLYDSRNRVKNIAYAGTTLAANSQRIYGYDANSNLLSVTEPAKTAANVVYTYDALNRALTETSQGKTHAYLYDVAGNRLSAVYGGTGRTIVSSYDELNRLSVMTEGGRATTYLYDLNGNLRYKTAPNGDVETSTFDDLNRATEQKTTSGADGNPQLCDFAYGYDLAGNVVSVDEQYPSLPDRHVANSYDDANRLHIEAVTGATEITTTYEYDDANNRSTMAIAGGSNAGTTSYGYNKLNQLTGYVKGSRSVALAYDYNGNRTRRTVTVGSDNGTDTYSYDFENRLIGVVKGTSGGAGTYAYAYDYRTRRIGRDESGASSGPATAIVFSGGTSVQEYDNGSSTPSVEYIRGSDYGGGVGGILYTLRPGTSGVEPSYTHENKRGDVVLKTGTDHSNTYQAQYEAFGQQTATSGTTPDRQKSNSKDTDPTNLVDEGFRYRDLETGMFITRDPAGFVDGPNLYTYVVQNPWAHFDPEGLSEDWHWGGWADYTGVGTAIHVLFDVGAYTREAAVNLVGALHQSVTNLQKAADINSRPSGGPMDLANQMMGTSENTCNTLPAVTTIAATVPGTSLTGFPTLPESRVASLASTETASVINNSRRAVSEEVVPIQTQETVVTTWKGPVDKSYVGGTLPGGNGSGMSAENGKFVYHGTTTAETVTTDGLSTAGRDAFGEINDQRGFSTTTDYNIALTWANFKASPAGGATGDPVVLRAHMADLPAQRNVPGESLDLNEHRIDVRDYSQVGAGVFERVTTP